MITQRDYRNGRKATTHKQAIVAKRISWPMVCVLMTCAKANGSKLDIVGKRGHGRTANYSVNIDGRALTPTDASALISAWKA